MRRATGPERRPAAGSASRSAAGSEAPGSRLTACRGPSGRRHRARLSRPGRDPHRAGWDRRRCPSRRGRRRPGRRWTRSRSCRRCRAGRHRRCPGSRGRRAGPNASCIRRRVVASRRGPDRTTLHDAAGPLGLECRAARAARAALTRPPLDRERDQARRARVAELFIRANLIVSGLADGSCAFTSAATPATIAAAAEVPPEAERRRLPRTVEQISRRARTGRRTACRRCRSRSGGRSCSSRRRRSGSAGPAPVEGSTCCRDRPAARRCRCPRCRPGRRTACRRRRLKISREARVVAASVSRSAVRGRCRRRRRRSGRQLAGVRQRLLEPDDVRLAAVVDRPQREDLGLGATPAIAIAVRATGGDRGRRRRCRGRRGPSASSIAQPLGLS